MVGGGVVMVVLMILILPVAVMLGGAIWSALMGFLLSENACDDAEAELHSESSAQRMKSISW